MNRAGSRFRKQYQALYPRSVSRIIAPIFVFVLAILTLGATQVTETDCEEGNYRIAFSSGPPNSRTGAPVDTTFERTCQSTCHDDNALNAPGGSMSLTPSASTFTYGDTISIVIDLERIGQQRWGFEITAIDDSLRPAGNLLLFDTIRTQISSAQNGREYVKHRSAGTDPGIPDTAPGWTVLWVAPPVVIGNVTFYAAGNASDQSFSSSGDYIYTASVTITEMPLDADADGIYDSYEALIGSDPANADSDSDNVADLIELGPDPLMPWNTDSDAALNVIDPDDDGDGWLTFQEDVNYNVDPTDDDTDGDGIPNYLDDDDDGDGILTINDACPLKHDPCEGCCINAGDADGGGSVDILDVTYLLDRIFQSTTPAPNCCQEADADGDGRVNVGDVVRLIRVIFIPGAPVPVCGPIDLTCGS